MADVEKESGSVGGDIEQGARKAISAGRTAAQAGKAVAKAASGNFVGAAKDVVQSEGLRKVIVVILCLSFLLTIVIFFAAPLAIYEGAKAYSDTIKERWLEDYYGANTGRVLAALKATFTGAWDVIKDLWPGAASGQTANDYGVYDQDAMTSDDILVFGPKDALLSVYKKKIDACINKIEARQGMIEEAIYASANGSLSDTGNINGWVYNNVYSTKDYWTYAELEDTRSVSYAGVSVSSGNQPMTRREAVKVIALYSAMYNCDVDLIQPYSLMKWLGYYDGSSATPMYFTVGDAVTCSVKGWQGEFMPMYLVEESVKNKEADYSKYQCAAADILLVVTSDPLSSLSPQVERSEHRRTEYEQRWEYGLQWRLMSADTYETWSSYYRTHNITYKAQASIFPNCQLYYQLQQYYRGDLNYYGMIDAYNAGELDWYLVYDYYTYWEPVEIVEYDYTLSYVLNASVTLRSADTIAKLAGFYQKPGTEDTGAEGFLDLDYDGYAPGQWTQSYVNAQGRRYLQFFQTDPEWTNIILNGNRTMGDIGCGLTSMATMLSGYGYVLKPRETNADPIYQNVSDRFPDMHQTRIDYPAWNVTSTCLQVYDCLTNKGGTVIFRFINDAKGIIHYEPGLDIRINGNGEYEVYIANTIKGGSFWASGWQSLEYIVSNLGDGYVFLYWQD